MPNDREAIIEVEAIVKGWVQGVGFRAATQSHATRLGLHGTVRNLPDGNVEVRVVGKKSEIELLLQILKHKTSPADVTEITLKEISPPGTYDSFQIK